MGLFDDVDASVRADLAKMKLMLETASEDAAGEDTAVEALDEFRGALSDFFNDGNDEDAAEAKVEQEDDREAGDDESEIPDCELDENIDYEDDDRSSRLCVGFYDTDGEFVTCGKVYDGFAQCCGDMYKACNRYGFSGPIKNSTGEVDGNTGLNSDGELIT